MSVSVSLAELEQGLFARLNTDATLLSLSVDVRRERMTKVVDNPLAPEMPVLTFWPVARVQLSGEPPHLIVQTDIWVWDTDDVDGSATLTSIDNALLASLENDGSARTWAYTRGAVTDHISTVQHEPAKDIPEKNMLRRRRLWQVAQA